jgi:glucose-6-phosphate dehydrogenase assembly protein OpcA
MAQTDAATDAFLDGQGIPVDLRDIEAELAKLWGPAAQHTGGPELENPHVTRIALANLLVERLDHDRESLAPVLETVIARFPCRAIVVRGSADPERRLTAEVSALCHLPAPGMPQVCSERIILRAGPNATDLVPGAVRPLFEAELPLFLWWTSDPRKHEALFRDLADECSRLILDLPDPGAEAGAIRLGLDRAICPSSRDSAWFALTSWRELIAQLFDPACRHETLASIEAVQIEACSLDTTRPPRLAIWMAAWLAGQLGWQPHGQPENVATTTKSTFRTAWQGPRGMVAVEILTRPAPSRPGASPQLLALSINARGPGGIETFHLERPAPDSPAVHVKAEAPDSCRLPRIVLAPELDPARRIAAALESSRRDPPFEKALPNALWLLDQWWV